MSERPTVQVPLPGENSSFRRGQSHKIRSYYRLAAIDFYWNFCCKTICLIHHGGSAVAKVSRVVRGGSWGIQSTAILVASLLALPPLGTAQAPAAQTPATPNPLGAPQAPNPAQLPVDSLTIYILEGRGQIHVIRNPASAMPVVEVRDENSLPLEGAEVVFDLPQVGPSGSFAGQRFTFTTRTNSQGQAAAIFTPNAETGRYNIRVTARAGNRIGHALIPQSNALRSGTAEPKSGLFKFAWWKVAVLAGVGATVGILVARGGSSGPSVTLIPGTPTFGAP